MSFRFILYLALMPMAWGQKVYFGVVGGTSITKDFHTIITPFTTLGTTYFDRIEGGSRSLIFGPSVEVGFPKNLSLRFDALHRTLKYEGSSDYPSSLPFRGSTPTWEFPILLKYRLPVGKANPFIAGGPSFRTYRNPEATRPSRVGAAAGAGVELHAGNFRFTPELRYTRWAAEDRPPFRPTNPDQLEFLVGVHYGTSSGSRNWFGKKVWLGVIAGIPLTNDLQPRADDGPYTGEIRRTADFRFAAGLMLEVPIAGNLSLEANALYRRLHFEDSPNVVVTWQLPVFAKYSFANLPLKPFVEAGPAFRVSGNLNNTNPSHVGIGTGIGLEAKAGWLRFTPTLRYTRWGSDGFVPLTSPPLTKRDQVELLVGFSF